MEPFNLNFWIICQMVFDFALVVLMLFFIRSMKSGIRKEAARDVSRQVMDMIEPLLKETEVVAAAFEAQLMEKKHLVNRLNEELDSRTASLNLLLNRAKACAPPGPERGAELSGPVHAQQDAILDLYSQDYDAATIAKRLSMPRGEVDLVIDLKRKFLSRK